MHRRGVAFLLGLAGAVTACATRSNVAHARSTPPAAASLAIRPIDATKPPPSMRMPRSDTGPFTDRAAPNPLGPRRRALDAEDDDSAYPTSQVISAAEAVRAVGIDPRSRDATLRVASVRRERLRDTAVVRNGSRFPSIDPRRVVYVVTATFSTTFCNHGGCWRSGTQTYVVDAVSGLVIIGETRGARVDGGRDGPFRGRARPDVGLRP